MLRVQVVLIAVASALLLAGGVCVAEVPFTPTSSPWGVKINSTGAMMEIPPRWMWGWGNSIVTGKSLPGYCGSMCFQVAGIFNGNYVSQELALLAANSTNEGGRDREILVGSGNAAAAAEKLGYNFSVWDWQREHQPQSTRFIDWARKEVDKGHVVISGWYLRQPHGDPNYDHIMPIVGYELSKDKKDVIGLYRYDLYLDRLSYTHGDDLHSSREQCSQKHKQVQPYHYCLPHDVDYGISIHGVVDERRELLRMKLIAPTWKEPDYGKEDQLHEAPVEFSFQAVIWGLTVGKQYTVLRFDSPDAVPRRDFKKGAYNANTTFTAQGETHKLTLVPVLSSGTWFYRTVEGTV